MFKLCAVVSSYFPDLEELEENVNSYLPWVDKLIVWENTPKTESNVDELVKRLNNTKIEIITTGQNEYLAGPFNTCVKWAKENGFTHILTMDQDSRFENGHFEYYRELITQFSNELIAVFAPNSQKYDVGSAVLEKDNVISSGAVMPLEIFDKVGLFNEDFLIYHVDIEFCRRVRSYGFKIIVFTNITLIHNEGYKRKMGMGLILNNYSAQSTYYIIRNSILLWKLYPESISLSEKFSFYKFKIVYRLAKLVFENDRIRKIRAIFLGLIHGYLSKKGRFEL
jgi:rhamnosyltransferase